jgi:CheY-like chemotaxis protein
VEDDDLVRDFALAQLTDLGYRVLEAANGNDALKILQEHKDIDLLFTDVVMPGGMNGYELAQEACRLRPMLNVLYTSGYVENAIMHRGMLDKDVQLLSKPYSRMELATKIRQALLQSSSTVGEQGRNAK